MKANETPILDGQIRTLNGIVPFVQPNRDLLWKQAFNDNSWFVIGHFDADGHKLNFLFHMLVLSVRPGAAAVNSVFSITDETTGWYYGDDQINRLGRAEVAADRFYITAPNGSMSGTLEEMRLQATMPKGRVDVTLRPTGGVIYNGGTGYFPMMDMGVYQYSVPNLHTEGTLTIEDKTYVLNGTSWFDRQWQHHRNKRKLEGHWVWMDLNLDNGKKASLWWIADDRGGTETAWATILHEDGTQTVAELAPLAESAHDRWRSPRSGQNYPTRWTVTIPGEDARLEVVPAIQEQEIVSKHPMLNKYEAACAVSGTYGGKNVGGYCYVELLGQWK